jgi:hypothetical protein
MKDKLARAFLTFEASFLSPAVTVVNTIGTTVMENNLDRIGARSANRKNRVEAGLRNILSQGYVYLKTSESDLPEYSSAVASIINAAVGFPSRQPDVSNPADRVDTVPPISFFDRVKLLLSRVAKMFIPDRYGPRDTSAAGSTGSAGAGSGAPPAEGNEDPEAGQAATAKGGGQRGGWTEGSKPVDRRDLDKSQMSSPALFALVEIGLPVLVAYLPDYPEWSEYPQSGGGGGYLKSKGWTQPREGVWRDPLTLLDYTEDVATGFQRARETQKGGAVDTEKDSWIESFNNVMEPLLIIAAEQIITDTDDMKEATVGQREYYTRGLDLLTAIQGEKPSIQLALATYELLCCSRFVTTTEFKNALGIDDPYEAKTIQLFFSGLESYSYRERPAIDTRSFLTNLKPLYARVRSNTAVKTAEEIRKDAETIVAVIMKKYEVEEVVKPTLTASSSAEEPTDVLNTSLTRGQTQDPGALEKSFSTPEVRPTQSAGKRRPLFTTP